MGFSQQRSVRRAKAANDSGYTSGASSMALPQVSFTKAHLKHLNAQLAQLEPMDVLRWAKMTIPNLYQTTAFGITGLAALDMLSQIQRESPSSQKVDIIFLDTLHHFQETLTLVDRVRDKYANMTVHIYRPDGVQSGDEFAAKHGAELWKHNADLYDWIAKVEPAQRAYQELNVAGVLTGRRRSQGGKRGDMDVIEVDEAGLVKINPLANWSFQQVQAYIREHNVPYNELLDRGYKSVGDWHSTTAIADGEDERSGRWRGQEKTECGIHNKRSRYAQFLMEAEQKRQREELAAALESVSHQQAWLESHDDFDDMEARDTDFDA